jgi:HK97 family phage portal protein
MELFRQFFDSRALTLKDPALNALFLSQKSIAGANITPENSLKISGWYAGVRILAETCASIPKIVYRRLPLGGKDRAPEHPVYKLVHTAPNPFMTVPEFYECMMAHTVCWGNSFAVIESNGGGRPIALWPQMPSQTRIQKADGRLWYYFRQPDGTELQAPQSAVLHVRALSSDGILGYSPVDLMREPLGLAKIEEEYRARFFANDARPGIALEYPGSLSEPAFQRYKQEWNEKFSGSENKFRIAFLEQGLKLTAIGFPPEAAQFIEGRKFQLEEIARILGIPLVLLQSTEKATSWGTGIEQFMLAFLQFTIMPWLNRWDARLNTSLFSESEQKVYFVESLIDYLLRADSITRATVLQIWRRNGIINADDWLELENRNPLPGNQGKTYIIEGNMTRLDQVGMTHEPDDDEPEPVPAMNGTSNGNGLAHG